MKHLFRQHNTYELELDIFMHKVNHLKLPEFFYQNESFTKIEAFHSHNTR